MDSEDEDSNEFLYQLDELVAFTEALANPSLEIERTENKNDGIEEANVEENSAQEEEVEEEGLDDEWTPELEGLDGSEEDENGIKEGEQGDENPRLNNSKARPSKRNETEDDICSQKIGSREDRKATKEKRLKGEAYQGYRRVDKKHSSLIRHDVPKEERKIGPRCDSNKCRKWETRECDSITEEERQQLFNTFWKNMSWDGKQMFVCSLVERKVISSSSSHRSMTNYYNLKVGPRKLPVCKKMFLNTFGLGSGSMDRWLDNYHNTSNPVPPSSRNASRSTEERDTEEPADGNPAATGSKQSRRARKNRVQLATDYLVSLPKVDSHYCRKDSRKQYLQGDIPSKQALFDLYKQYCDEHDNDPVSVTTLAKLTKQLNIAIFKPRKDQCDICCSFQKKHVKQEIYERHISLKTRAREEKDIDKAAALKKECHVVTCDLMNVQCLPMLKASAAYYKLKLTVHNFTIYNLETHDANNYWFDETVATLEASTFATCLVNYIDELVSKEYRPTVVVFSDGCTYQNRNSILANALLHLSSKLNIKIYQKYLEKGHTQMEGDSVHAHIERAIGGHDVFLPHNFTTWTTAARKSLFPYRAKYLDENFVLNFSEDMIYSSIRPGNKKYEPVVTDLRWIEYDGARSMINYKLHFDDDPLPLPRRPLKKLSQEEPYNFPPVRATKIKITYDKWSDLQSLKPMMPSDTHLFYDTIPFESHSIRKEKRAEKLKNNKASNSGIAKKRMKSKTSTSEEDPKKKRKASTSRVEEMASTSKIRKKNSNDKLVTM